MFLVLHLNSVSQLCSWIFNLEVKHVVYLFLLLLLMLLIAARRMAAIPGPGPGRHRHFNYTLRYNAVTMKEVQFKKCWSLFQVRNSLYLYTSDKKH